MAGSRTLLGHGDRRFGVLRWMLTAAFLLGVEAGRALLEGTPDVEGALITEAGSVLDDRNGPTLGSAKEPLGGVADPLAGGGAHHGHFVAAEERVITAATSRAACPVL